MKITMLAIGSRGDVQPYIALGLGLQAAGHQVCLATHTAYETAIKERGLDFFPIESDPQALLNTEEGQALLDTGRNFIDLMRQLKSIIEPFIQSLLVDLWHACRGADAILYSILAFPGYFIAQILGIPSYAVCLQPLSRTRFFPSILAPSRFSAGQTYNAWTHLIAEQVFWQPVRPLIHQWARQFQLPPIPFWGHWKQYHKDHLPIIYGYSPIVVPKPPDWPESINVTGYWFLDRPSDWCPPAELVNFLESGEPPICVGFGSMKHKQAEKAIVQVLQALKQIGKRGILLTGWSGLSNTDLSDRVFKIDAVPHDWLFPKVEAVVHHGGAGTTAAALRAGVPSVVVPFFYDQSFWGQRLRELRLGPGPMQIKSLNTARLIQAIHMATTNKQIFKNVGEVSRRIRLEQGVSCAVQAFHSGLPIPQRAPHFLTK